MAGTTLGLGGSPLWGIGGRFGSATSFGADCSLPDLSVERLGFWVLAWSSHDSRDGAMEAVFPLGGIRWRAIVLRMTRLPSYDENLEVSLTPP